MCTNKNEKNLELVEKEYKLNRFILIQIVYNKEIDIQIKIEALRLFREMSFQNKKNDNEYQF